MSAFETIDVRYAGSVAHVQLNRPHALNAINQRMADELVAVTTEFAARSEAKVVVVRGAGRAFSAGADVGDVGETEPSAAALVRGHQRMQSALEEFASLPLVKIAQVHGHCVGAGFVLAAMCDLRLAGPDARFSIPELDFGIPFSMGGLPTVARYIGMTRTAELVLTGRRMPADEALSVGFLTHVIPTENLAATVEEMAVGIARHPAYLIRETVTRLREAGQELLASDRSDLSSLTLAMLDPECREVMTTYAQRIRAGKAA